MSEFAPDFQSTGDPDEDLKALRALKTMQERMVEKPTRSAEVPSLTEDPEKIPYYPITRSAGDALPLATLLMGNPSTMLGRMALNTGVGAGSELLKGGGPEDIAKVGLGSGLLGAGLEKAGQFGRYIGSAIPNRMFNTERAAAIGDWLKQNVPWWNKFESSHAGIDEMATGVRGKEALSKGYDEAFMAARDKIPEDAMAVVPDWVARGLKMAGAAGERLSEGTQAALRGAEAGAGDVVVNARSLLDKLPGSQGDIRDAIERGLRPIAGALIPEAQKAYSFGRGWQEAAARGQFLTGGKFDAAKAQAALRNAVGEESMGQAVLAPRGMGQLEELINGPLGRASIVQSGLLGGIHGGLGAHGWRAWLPQPTVYKNVPPQIPQIGDVGRAALRVTLPGFLSNMLTTERD